MVINTRKNINKMKDKVFWPLRKAGHIYYVDIVLNFIGLGNYTLTVIQGLQSNDCIVFRK